MCARFPNFFFCFWTDNDQSHSCHKKQRWSGESRVFQVTHSVMSLHKSITYKQLKEHQIRWRQGARVIIMEINQKACTIQQIKSVYFFQEEPRSLQSQKLIGSRSKVRLFNYSWTHISNKQLLCLVIGGTWHWIWNQMSL